MAIIAEDKETTKSGGLFGNIAMMRYRLKLEKRNCSEWLRQPKLNHSES